MEFFTAMNLVIAAIIVISVINVILVGYLLVTWGEIRGANKTWEEVLELVPNLEYTAQGGN
jgi:hypothetical protein